MNNGKGAWSRGAAAVGLCALLWAMGAALFLAPGSALAGDLARPYWWGRLETLAQRDGYKLMRPAELKALYDQGEPMIIIDARTSHEYQAGHLPGARNVEFHLGHASRLDSAKEAELKKALGPDPNVRVVVYDRGLQCVRSQLAAQWAVNLGHKNVWHLPEGWMGWAALTQTQGSEGPRQAGAGDPWPQARFTLLGGEPDRTYLGLQPQAANFQAARLGFGYLLVELYNQLCFACCQSVPELNRLHGLIAADPALAGRLKMMGVGVGNMAREVNRFRREQEVAFPLVADHESVLHKSLGRPALPVIYLVRLGQSPRIVAVANSPFPPAPELLARIKSFMATDQGG